MSEYWVWNNQQRGWRGRNRNEFVLQLQLAGRFAEHIATQYVQASNAVIDPTDYPIEVMVEVNDTFLTPEAQRILAEYNRTGDRGVIDAAYFKAQDRALFASPELQESLAQMQRGEGRQIYPKEFGKGVE